MKTLRILFLLLVLGTGSNIVKAQNDVGITTVAAPYSGCNLSCMPPNIYLYNNTGATIWGGNYQICYSVGSYSFCEVINIPNFGSGSTYDYTFTDTFCFATQGTYNFTFSITMVAPLPVNGGDVNPSNNTASITVVNDTTVVPGVVSMSDSVCQGINNGTLTLTNYTGYPGAWQYDDGSGWMASSCLNGSVCGYTNLNQTTIYRVWQDGGFCPGAWSQWAVITTVAPPIGGTAVSSASTICANTNTFQVGVSGQTGVVVGWNTAPDCSTWTQDVSLGNGVQVNPVNIPQTTCYQAIIGNGGYCPNTTSSSVNVIATPPTMAGCVSADATVCAGNNGDTLFLTGYQGAVLSWIAIDSNGQWTLANILPAMQLYNNLNTTTQFAAVVQNGICPADTSAVATITVIPSPVIFAGNDTTVSLGGTVCLNATGTTNYLWTPATGLNNNSISNPCFTGASPGTFILTVTGTDNWGCTDADQISIVVLDTVTVFPPVVCNFVTPNNDGLNDVWNIMNISRYPDNSVQVYNNHGQEIFAKNGYNNDWDGTYNGKQLPDGSYYYVVTINSIDRTFKGVVTITDTRRP